MDYLKVGQIVNTHGIKGDIKVYPYTDDIQNIAKSKQIFLDEQLTISYKVVKSAILKNMVLFHLEGINTIEATKPLLQQYIYMKKQEIKEENTYYIADLIGVQVFVVDSVDNLTDDTLLGVITQVTNVTANDVYEIKTNNGNVYIPAIKDIVMKVDIKLKKMYIKMMEGLI